MNGKGAECMNRRERIPGHVYSLSAYKNCKNPVDTREQCIAAAKFIDHEKDVIFAKATGEGDDLPHGCIFYRKHRFVGKLLVSTQRYIFWNPKGGLLSLDEDVQQVCYESGTSSTGTDFQ